MQSLISYDKHIFLPSVIQGVNYWDLFPAGLNQDRNKKTKINILPDPSHHRKVTWGQTTPAHWSLIIDH